MLIFFANFLTLHAGEDLKEKLLFPDEAGENTHRGRIFLNPQRGKRNIKKELEGALANLKQAMPLSLFIIVDKDAPAKDNLGFEDYQKIFKESPFQIDIPRANTIVPIAVKKQSIAVGIFEIGDEANTYWDLETLLLLARTQTNLAYEKIVEHFIAQCGELEVKPQYLESKSKVSVYLASMPKWSNSLGYALIEDKKKKKDAYFDADHPEFKRLFGELIQYLKAPETYFSTTP
jgi:hypothetical protein